MANERKPKLLVIGAGPVGALAALYAGRRGFDVEVYELRNGMDSDFKICMQFCENVPRRRH